jgi:hypothetical protein
MRSVMKPSEERDRGGDGQPMNSVSQGETPWVGGQPGRGVGAEADKGRLAE